MEKAEQWSQQSEEAALAMERGDATKMERRRGRWLLPVWRATARRDGGGEAAEGEAQGRVRRVGGDGLLVS